jgi:hypothetical protein
LAPRNIVGLKNPESAQELAVEIGFLEVCVRQRRQRAEDVPVVLRFAERGLDAPNADENRSRDTEFFLDCTQCVVPLRRLACRGGEPRRRRHGIDVGAEWLAVFRRMLHSAEHTRVRCHARERGVECRPRNALRLRLPPERGNERIKWFASHAVCMRGDKHEQQDLCCASQD